jgi:hypothetical protein
MAFILHISSKNIRGLKRDNNAEPAATPHQRGMVMVKQDRQENNWKLGRTHKVVHKQFQFDLQTTSIDRKGQSLHTEAQRITAVIYTTLEHYQKFCSRRF